MINIDGAWFDRSIRHFTFAGSRDIARMAELGKLCELSHLRSACFSGSNLDDAGLAHLAKAKSIEDLNLQWTEISDQGLAHLATLPRLTSLRLKENDQLTNDCIVHLLKLNNLVDLQIHGTSIDQSGLDRLAPMTQLAHICITLDGDNFSRLALLALSRRMPWCSILVKGNGEFCDGGFEGKW
ncbi:hypothetical protein INH39_29240 [Massilia violaceinigra]|uniref:Leucine Rich repeats (2 copies) n=1 Tax=Massilia violaceinigra TaxID=2045208 RepID=A0ABY4A453_9BURK|nr:hypothetical protein [Massilia violaceinigra]UOD29443.1 hypothetical protein INH39_29240 [Massilia violaceinigra]